jgi:serine/threonine protein kinase
LRNQVFALDEANRRVVVGVVVIAFLGVLFLAGVLVVEDSVWSKDALSAPSIVVAGFIVLAGSQCVSLARAAANRAFPSQRQRDEAYRQSRRTQDEHATGPTVGLAPGAVLRGRYVVQSHLGQGGQGVVLVAFDSRDNQTVAVKVVPALRARGADREVAAGHRLDHANVVPLLDWYAEGEQVFLVTPFMANGSLKDQLTRKGRLDAKSARRIVLDVLHGLAAAHAAGVIHGDVKPANVLLDADGTARLVDFGAAYVLTNNSRTIDQPKGGSIPGTLCYLPPEAFADQPPTAAWDTYAVGTLLFELLQGAPPHPQEEAGPHVPFATIINTARRNDSTARFASAQEMARSLAAATYPEEIE